MRKILGKIQSIQILLLVMNNSNKKNDDEEDEIKITKKKES